MSTPELISELILRECPDRRARRWIAHCEVVQIDGQLVMARDISSNGLSVVMRSPAAVGDQVSVTLMRGARGGAPTVTRARVVRVERHSRRAVAGLEFVL